MSGSTVFWYASRATGIVALLLLTAVLVLGILVNRQGRLPGLPRFAVTSLHRNLSLLSVVFIAVHVFAAVLDTFVSIPLAASVIPFASGYERFWLGLGAISLDLMIAMIVTSLLRGHLNRILWRGIHLLAYVSWPVAFAHSIGSSKDLQHGLAALPRHRLCPDRRRRGDLPLGPRGTASAQGCPGRGRLRPAHRRGGQAPPAKPREGVPMTTIPMTMPMNPSTSVRPQAGLPRLLPPAPEDLRGHLARLGPTPYRGRAGLLIGDIETSGLTGRGGAAFPVYRKMAIVAQARGRKVMVANGAESSRPAARTSCCCGSRRTSSWTACSWPPRRSAPARPTCTCTPGRHPPSSGRWPTGAPRAWTRYRSRSRRPRRGSWPGQETALVNRLGGGPALPTFAPPRVTERGLGGAPTLVQNVETLAHLALIARYGPRWFRAAGTAAEPGSMLTSIYSPDGKCQVVETEIGAPLRTLLSSGPETQAWLVGGYHGSWLPVAQAAGLALDNDSLRRYGATVGAGVLVALPSDRCGLTEAARVTGYLAAEWAGQCGPCLNGLPRIAAGLAELAGRGHRKQVRADLERWAGLVTGRGACNHPDGTVRFVRSALLVFAPEISLHGRGHCSATNHRPFLPLPDGVPTSEEDWT